MSHGPVHIDRKDDRALIRLDRPDQFNAINGELAEGLFAALEEVGADDSIRAVVLTGSGRAFCAGGDLAKIWEEAQADTARQFYELAGDFHDAILEMRRLPKILVAAINGPAVGGGLSLALACDLRVVSAEAYLKVGYTSSGLTMDGGGSHFLPRIVGLGRATEMIALDEEIDAERAASIGLVNDVAPSGAVVDEALELADRAAEKSRRALAETKRLMNRSFDQSLEKQLEDERRTIARAASSPEGREGIEAFLEKRAAEFRDL